jgi:DNA-binding transcriptional ArsR family regulator
MESKEKILKELERAYPSDLSIGEVARRAKVSRPTASTWLKVLEAEGKAEISRKIGAAVFYKLKKAEEG